MSEETACAMNKRRKEASSTSLSPWLTVLLLLVILGMNYHLMAKLESTEMLDRVRRMQVLTNMAADNQNMQAYAQQSPGIGGSTNAKKTMTNRLYLPIPARAKGIVKNIVKPGDYIYYQDEQYPHWDAAPIVIEKYKLVFFTIPKVGCTVWKQLFRRMMGYSDWQSQDYIKNLPHNPSINGLKYLYDYSLEEASEIMTSPEWTRAIMVRDPKYRFLSAFLDKAVSNDHVHIINRCCPNKSCVEDAQTIPGFVKLVQVCDDEHWLGQHRRIDSKFWPYMDWVGHVETAEEDARALLQKIGAWEEYGASGWGEHGSLAIFQSKDIAGAGEHATWSQWKIWQWYTPDSEKMVERFYQADYMNPLFQFERDTCLTCQKDESEGQS